MGRKPSYPANAKPVLTLTSHVSLKNYAVDLSVPGKGGQECLARLRGLKYET
jgi:hypothetical protein